MGSEDIYDLATFNHLKGVRYVTRYCICVAGC